MAKTSVNAGLSYKNENLRFDVVCVRLDTLWAVGDRQAGSVWVGKAVLPHYHHWCVFNPKLLQWSRSVAKRPDCGCAGSFQVSNCVSVNGELLKKRAFLIVWIPWINKGLKKNLRVKTFKLWPGKSKSRPRLASRSQTPELPMNIENWLTKQTWAVFFF